jgi:MutS domain V
MIDLSEESLESFPQMDFAFSIELFSCTDQKPPSPKLLYEPFQLPIAYLDASCVHSLSPIVSADLELTSSSGEAMYHYLFQPEHSLSKSMIQEWNKSYTTNTDFLKDSQAVLGDMGKYEYKMNQEDSYVFDSSACDNLMNIWNGVKEDSSFLERYSFIEWDFLKSFNESESFLQTLSFMNLSSPVMSLLIPVLFVIFPFIVLLIQGIPITFDIYLATLKDIARNHFIGKALFGIQHLNLEKALYLIVTVALYLLQIYQNIAICRRFYRNIQRINDQLCELRQYVGYSIKSMDTFCALNRDKYTYLEFCERTAAHSTRLRSLLEILTPIQPFAYTFSKVFEFGYLLKCVYAFYSDPHYDTSLRYSFGFEGYIHNLRGISKHLQSGAISISKYEEEGALKMEAQYYPPGVRGETSCKTSTVKNRCNLSKNMIITGPNASGKTTFLKTTTINIIFSQQVGCGFYRSCSLSPYTHIHSYLNIPDTSGRDSLFQAESRRCKDIIDIILENQSATNRHFCIFDELYSGTNPGEATKSAYAFLKYLANYKNVDFILTTHYLSVCRRFKDSDTIQNYKMDAEIDADSGKITYTYKIRRGISRIQGAVKILEEMDYPREILDTIRGK